jgi:ketosteroid isomerase-like protein
MSDQKLKQALEQIGVAYAECFNRRDATGIAALFVGGGVHVNEAGPRKDIEQFYQAAFKAGSSSRMDTSLDEVWPLGTDVATSIGEVRITGKDPSGAAIERVRRCAATYVRGGRTWKIQMIATLPKQ